MLPLRVTVVFGLVWFKAYLLRLVRFYQAYCTLVVRHC